MIKWLKSRGFSDRLYFLNLILSWIFIIICIIVTYTVDAHTDLVTVGIPAIFAELGVHTGYIVWKAKNENINKHPIDDEDSSKPSNRLDDAIGFEVYEESEELTDD